MNLDAIFALARRYGRVLRLCWAHRDAAAPPSRSADELAFLPAVASVEDTPPHPAARWLGLMICALLFCALAWAVLGKVDIVAVAPGRIIVSDRTKLIQPLETSVVLRVLVKDGDKVKAGQVLVELDPTAPMADRASALEQRSAAQSEAQRTQALIQALEDGEAPQLAGADRADRAQLRAEWQDIRARADQLEAEAQRKKDEIQTVEQLIAKLEATLPMARARESDFASLGADGYVAQHAYQDRVRQRLEMEKDLLAHRARLDEARSGLRAARQARTAALAEIRRALHERNTQASTKFQQFTQEEAKAAQRERLTRLTAPVDGVVQQLAVHTTGGVVTPAQTLMVVVPEGAQVSAEVNVANLDIGFVTEGQTAEVKLETFPYTRYGTVEAKVAMVASDAVVDEKKGAYFPAILTLSARQMVIEGKPINLSPGMSLVAEIRTGDRRVIDYLLSPLQRAGGESLRER